MMSNINVMVDEEITKEATEIFTKLGFDMNTAINIFLRSAIRKKGIPFDLLVDEVDDFANFNDETIEEAERICKDPNRKRFSSSKELREAFGI
ncbi:type II toxin-antitoxin system RelB/DinJ family antitoxin [Fusobacterium animalis]|uniref:type II toxin-antitoxin system RelB/DinJ family antitoxin n=1 Tax=Fusobacterium animalis TaxID=76859 RepID=UPI0030CD1595